MAPDRSSHEGGLSVRDQIERYRTAFISVVTMIVIAAAVGGYILAHENLHAARAGCRCSATTTTS